MPAPSPSGPCWSAPPATIPSPRATPTRCPGPAHVTSPPHDSRTNSPLTESSATQRRRPAAAHPVSQKIASGRSTRPSGRCWDSCTTARSPAGTWSPPPSRRSGTSGSLTRSQVYRELASMAQDGLIEADEVGPATAGSTGSQTPGVKRSRPGSSRNQARNRSGTRCYSPSPSPATCTPPRSPNSSPATAPSTPPGTMPTATSGLPPKLPARHHVT